MPRQDAARKNHVVGCAARVIREPTEVRLGEVIVSTRILRVEVNRGSELARGEQLFWIHIPLIAAAGRSSENERRAPRKAWERIRS